MEMKAIEAITIGEDLTPPLRPLAAVLRHAALKTHCSACFAALPPEPHLPLTVDHVALLEAGFPCPLYCSLPCATVDSTLHSESHEQHLLCILADSPLSSWPESSLLRLSLRLARILQKLPERCRFLPTIPFLGEDESLFQPNRERDEILERIIGLMTNRRDLILTVIKKLRDEGQVYDKNLERIREGVAIIAKARGNYADKYRELITRLTGEDVNIDKEVGYALEEISLCLVMTNAVEVLDKKGKWIGFALYDHAFSWINHSCSPNSCCQFLLGKEEKDEQRKFLRIAPAGEEGRIHLDVDGLKIGDLICPFSVSERYDHGPRVVVRSIKSIRRDEAVTIAYTDLFLPKEKRQAELWLKYRFNCNCKRCGAEPTGYVDSVLQALSADSPENPESNEIEQLMQNMNLADTICDYAANGDSKTCCQNLECLLYYGDFSDNLLEPNEASSSSRKQKLHLCNYFSINAYNALASAYIARGDELTDLDFKVEAHNMYKTSSAYSLLVAGVVNHLFTSEPSLAVAAENSWMAAGESLLKHWNDAFFTDMPFRVVMSSLTGLKCKDCSLGAYLDPNTVCPDRKEMQVEEMKIELYNCIAKLTPKVWRYLASESKFLGSIQNPVDLSWVDDSREALEGSDGNLLLNVPVYGVDVGTHLVDLGVHCLRYGSLLKSICYGLSVDANFRGALDFLKQT